MPFFDGHLHSTASDGQLAPGAVVDAVHAAGGSMMALTDHDTFAGHAEAAARAAVLGLGFIPGVEMSLGLDGREIHVLAYFVDQQASALAAALDEAQRARRDHLPAMVARLVGLGYPITVDDVLAELTPTAPGDRPTTIGRPHVARALVRRGLFRTVNEVFARLLGNDQPGHVRRPLPAAATMIGLAGAAGGVCSIAHPGVNQLGGDELQRLAACGLAGIEVYHPDHDNGDIIFYLRECQRLDLVATGGSDYHGGAPYPAATSGLDHAGYQRLRDRRGSPGN